MEKIIITLLLITACMSHSGYANPPTNNKATPEERKKALEAKKVVAEKNEIIRYLQNFSGDESEQQKVMKNLGISNTVNLSKASAKLLSNYRTTNDPKDNTLERGFELAREAFEGEDPSSPKSKLQEAEDKDYKHAVAGFYNAESELYKYDKDTRTDILTAKKWIGDAKTINEAYKIYNSLKGRDDELAQKYKKDLLGAISRTNNTPYAKVSKYTDEELETQAGKTVKMLKNGVNKLREKFEKACKTGSCLATQSGPKK